MALTLVNVQASAAQKITYRGLGGGPNAYHSELLQQIFDHVKPNTYTVKRFDEQVPHLRAFQMLSTNTELDIVIGYATKARINKHLAIALPVRKGLNGWRIPLIHKDNEAMFKQVNSLKSLQKLTPGMFHTWSDNEILASNGIQAVKGSNLKGLYQMLDKKRFDYIPVSILTGTRKLKHYQDVEGLNVVLADDVLIHYPICFYFYVNKENTKLANIITQGFEKIIANGQYDRIFNQYYGDPLRKRFAFNPKIIRLENKLLPKNVPLERRELWLAPEHYKQD
ncbi:substrate-binding periplasmic protein [Thalassotalea sp. PLHSN55]|uniref:substrate-binding periplasmic protein n=1 Tax=Thalassotalea sp. PLHSN55 TaxID=3435888 RepID=UPI003F840A25